MFGKLQLLFSGSRHNGKGLYFFLVLLWLLWDPTLVVFVFSFFIHTRAHVSPDDALVGLHLFLFTWKGGRISRERVLFIVFVFSKALPAGGNFSHLVGSGLHGSRLRGGGGAFPWRRRTPTAAAGRSM
ncbi:uncharacterized protein GLRG_02807 [Colletotrichum graminicola M1.001]|uniref:Uncharacterized protein n=1 Tax=Colletotrichum graminicola (strain M1.001 / M2 / FGSC 10212) TaxID=645133 RepID=E3Q9X5_COLGM|nr:uncharacterized protein GLRG_02807 [Colletotrichum graminicola M1.001]EFQ27663.1 hypothetical protein GLRG_02807 [Colletotrichum graminicola M1.001]